MVSSSGFSDLVWQVGQGPTRPVSVTVTQGTFAAAKEMAGERGLSSFVEEALQRQIRRVKLRELVDWMAEGQEDPIDWEDVDRKAEILRKHEAFVRELEEQAPAQSSKPGTEHQSKEAA
ncbi:MAG: hypothetical protein LBR20_03385 [Propionibacteriaceae bacterium]|jgi:hypothetical protein|nr:hypothetical protein [Propionibacteriaceae bacterium]